MHIKIEDQETGVESVMCIDRSAKTAEILALHPGHQNLLIQVAQSVGATKLYMLAREDYSVEFLSHYGFKRALDAQIYVKEL